MVSAAYAKKTKKKDLLHIIIQMKEDIGIYATNVTIGLKPNPFVYDYNLNLNLK